MEWEEDLTKPLKNEGREIMSTNWMSRMRDDFIQRLPQKLKSGLDSEDLFDLDLSAVQGLLQGI